MVGGNTKEVKDATIKASKTLIEKSKLTLKKHRHEGLELVILFKIL